MKKWTTNLFNKTSGHGNLIGAIEHVLKLGANTTKREEWAPYHWLPNVSKVRVELSQWDEIAGRFGISKREDAGELHYVEYKNRKFNRYALHMIKLMKGSTNKRFWILAEITLHRSVVFFYLAIKHVFPNWHRDMPFGDIIKIYRKYLKLVKDPKNIDFKRVYLQEPTKFRPLGVPSPLYRVYLHALNQLLVLRLEPTISESQHGFRPLKGTMTAWLEVLKLIPKYKYIYEFDYKGFFNNLEITKISDCLRDKEVPESWIQMIENLNKSQPQLTKVDRVDEFKARQFEYISKCLKEEIEPSGPYWEPIKNEILIAFGSTNPQESELLMLVLEEGIGEYWSVEDIYRRPNLVLLKYVEVQWALLASYGHGMFYTMLQGVPQGAPTSPFLSILLLDWICKDKDQDYKIVRYADDGVIFSNKPIEILETEEMLSAGIIYAKQKCKYVKFDDKWVSSLKFLGLIYEDEVLKASTRKGSKLIYDKESMLEAIEQGYLTRWYTKSEGSFDNFIKSSLKGFIMSRLYIGSWNLEDYFQDFTLKYKRGSWVWHYVKWVERTTGRHAIVSGLLGVKLSVFNSSSICIPWIMEALTQIRDNKKWGLRGSTKNTRK